MNKNEIPEGAIEIVARHINERNNRPSKILLSPLKAKLKHRTTLK